MGSCDHDHRILTPSLCDFLNDEMGLEQASQGTYRWRFRKYIRFAIAEFPLLYDRLSIEHIRKIFYPPKKDPVSRSALVAGIALLYTGAGLNPELEASAVLSDGVETAEAGFGNHATVTVDRQQIGVDAFVTDREEELEGEILEAISTLQALGYHRDADDPFSHRYGRPQDHHHRTALDADPTFENEKDTTDFSGNG